MKIKKIIISASIVIVATALAFWINSRWTAWFASPDEIDFSYTQYPDRITLTPGEDFVCDRTISWRCDTVMLESRLALAANGDTTYFPAKANLVVSRGGKDIFYNVELEDLTPNSTYSYRVTTNGNSSKWYSFTTPSANGNRKIIYVGDIQDTVGGTSKDLFRKLYKEHSDAAFWAFGGDLIEAPIDKYWSYLYKSADSTFATMPIVCATGNHEYLKTAYRTLDPRWTKTFVYPDNGATFFKGRSYYIKDENIIMAVLDTNGVQDILTIMSEYRWLKEILEDEGENRWKIVMFHHPLYSVRPKKNNFMLRNAFDPLLKKHGVHLVLQAHEHGYGSYAANNDDKNYPLYVISHASPKSYKTADHKDNMKIVPNTQMYQIIETSPNTLTYKALNALTDSIIDNINLTK